MASKLPTVSKLCLYGEFLSRSFKSVNSIQNYISGVKTLHLLAGFEFPSENVPSAKADFLENSVSFRK
jgi:hypothetical protein